MNDGFYNNYDIFYGNNFQPPDMGSDFTNVPHGNPPSDSNNPHSAAAAALVTADSQNSAGAISFHTNIPFVQIHTTDVQPPKRSYGNSFRRQHVNYEAIKSEPIKSEQSDAIKDAINGRTTASPANLQARRNVKVTLDTDTVMVTDVRITTTPQAVSAENTTPTTIAPPAVEEDVRVSPNTLTDEPLSATMPTIYKCNQCPFMSLSAEDLTAHKETIHSNSNATQHDASQSVLYCPGCEKTFYSSEKLGLHLNQYHLMKNEDCVGLLRAITRKSTSQNDPQRKSRIYLKNMEYLRDPRQYENNNSLSETYYPRNYIQEHDNVTNEMDVNNENSAISEENGDGGGDGGKQTTTTTTSNQQRPKQKISIKSVDVLTDAALLRRHYEMENAPPTPPPCPYTTNGTYETVTNIGNDSQINNGNFINSNNNNNNNSSINNYNDMSIVEPEKEQRKPKIYIKEVNKLINFNNFIQQTQQQQQQEQQLQQEEHQQQHQQDIELSDLQIEQQIQMPHECIEYLYEAHSNSAIHQAKNFLPTDLTNGIDNYLFGPGQSNSNSTNAFLMDDNRHYMLHDNVGLDCGSFSSSSTPIITEVTPPPAPVLPTSQLSAMGSSSSITPDPMELQMQTSQQQQQPQQQPVQPQRTQQTIFIKNVDILKAPQYQDQQHHHQQRGTLHLRTVDELNLMNKNEVENLITPNLESTIGSNGGGGGSSNNTNIISSSGIHNHPISASALHDQNFPISNDTLKWQDLDLGTTSQWVEDYSLDDDIDCIITNNIMHPFDSPNKALNDLDASSMSIISIRDIEDLTRIGADASGEVNEQQSIDIEGEATIICEIDGPNKDVTSQSQLNVVEDNFAEDYNRSLCVAQLKPNDPAMATTSPSVYGPLCSNLVVASLPTTSPKAPHSVEAAGPMSLISIRAMDELMTTWTENVEVAENSVYVAKDPDALAKTVPSINVAVNQPEGSTIRINGPNSPVKMALPILTHHGFSNTPPPLVPVSSQAKIRANDAGEMTPNNEHAQLANLPVPPLVPVTSQLQNNATAKQRTNEKGRIYVSTNLMEVAVKKTNNLPTSNNIDLTGSNDIASTTVDYVQPDAPVSHKRPASKSKVVSLSGGISVRGRPFGSKETMATKRQSKNNDQCSSDPAADARCTVKGCTFRFKKLETLEYHKKCHTTSTTTPIQCPECLLSNFNWNTLHTHLWRNHKIDMELYSCELCNFKTPMYSRLVNTHAKTHFDNREYACEQCDKTFKNAKQLKNHRRRHRMDPNTADLSDSQSASSQKPLSQCSDCGAAFSNNKTLREHLCKMGSTMVQCELCGRLLSSKSSLKLHMLTHENGTSKRFKCDSCQYESNDHNAFRRHNMTHDQTKMYKCPFCAYKSIQSVPFQKHINQKHPEQASSVVHKCPECSFSTINRLLWLVHKAKHPNTNSTATAEESVNESAGSLAGNEVASQQKSKIKVRSGLLKKQERKVKK